MRALLLATILSILFACGGDDVADAPDGGPDAAVPVTVWEHLVAAGDWIQDFRMRDFNCTGCRTVVRFEPVPDEECGCVRMSLHLYWDVVATDDAQGLVDGDEQCLEIYEMDELLVDGVDPAVRSLVQGTLITSTCGGGGVGGQLNLIFDAQQIDADGRPGLIAMLQPGQANAFFHVAGYPTDPDDLQNAAIPLVRCALADRIAGRDYCMPSCDWPGADAGRSACDFPDYEDPGLYDLSCLGDPHLMTAPDPLTLMGDVRALVTGAAVVGAAMEAHLVSDEALIASTTSTAGGAYSMAHATGGVALDTYIKATASGYRDGYVFSFEPFTNHANVYPRLTTAADSDAFAAAAGTALVAGTGALVVIVQDCSGARIPGAVVAVAGATAVYADAAGAPDASLTATGSEAMAVFLNLAPGPVDAIITVGGMTFGARPARVFADSTSSHWRTP